MHLLASARDTDSLDGTWQAIPDQYEVFADHFEDFIDTEEGDGPAVFAPKPIYEPGASVENDPADFNIDDGRSVKVPSSWGEEITEFRHFEGIVWFARRFDLPPQSDTRTLLRFGAVNYKAKVWLNGKLLGTHEGGYTPFDFDITEEVQETDNVLLVQVDNNRYENGIPSDTTDWFNFGGINRPVELITVPETYVRNFKVEASLAGEEVTVDVTVWLKGPAADGDPAVVFPELDRQQELKQTETGEFAATLSLSTDEVSLWSPTDPTLYTIEIQAGKDTLVDTIGLRDVEVAGSDILVNGESIWLRGITLHEEVAGKGRALDDEDIETRFEWLNELGCNFARLAHYPHTEAMARKADEEGILLWEEVPAYWNVNFGTESVQDLYRQHLRELIQRDWNRASVILWSIANETDHTDDTRNEVLPMMADYARSLDDSRLVTAACFVNDTDSGIIIDDPLESYLDVIGINEYYGWYYGDAQKMEAFQERPDETPIVISETGAGGKWGLHGEEDERWTEEHQAAIYRVKTTIARDNDQIAGFSPWVLFDFRTPRRQNEYQRGYNRKGILNQCGNKKQAFHVLKDFYRSEAKR